MRTALCVVSLLLVTPGALLAQGVSYVYDELGRLIAVSDPSGDTAVYTYDAVGNVTSIARHASSVVSVIHFAPTSGPVGTTVTIYGTGFSSTPGLNTVTFNGTAASITAGSSTHLVVAVPAGATTGVIAVTAQQARHRAVSPLSWRPVRQVHRRSRDSRPLSLLPARQCQ